LSVSYIGRIAFSVIGLVIPEVLSCSGSSINVGVLPIHCN